MVALEKGEMLFIFEADKKLDKISVIEI